MRTKNFTRNFFQIFIFAITLPEISSAQNYLLDESCVVSVLNRTIPVSSDGGWTLPNVPSFMGQIRARANCVVDGVTVSGESEFFSVIQDGITQVGEISFENTTPVPSSLLFVNQDEVVLSSNSAIQFDVIAEYSDGSQSDVLSSGSGVNFNSSNPAIAMVNSDGLVTPLTSGNVLITARLEGALAIKPVFISLSGDVDGDGLPDDFELLNGLDPNDAVDAMEDQDSDGLSALEEFGIGTDINQADSDNDGLEDGEEVVLGEDGFITDPLLSDTDGDQISDGLELIAGSDPTDSSSFDLSSVLDSIDIEQEDFELIFNGIQTEVSAQLSVIGYLTDGSSLDLTTLGSTQYSSSDLTILSFGLNPGQVFGGQDGTATVTVNNSGQVDIVNIDISSYEPEFLSALEIPGEVHNVDITSSYAFIAAGSAGLQIVDLLDPELPYIVASIPSGDEARDVKVYGNRLYVADGTAGLLVVDISDPINPIVSGSYLSDGVYQDLALSDGYLAVAAGLAGIDLLSISDPDDPVFISRLSDIDEAIAVDLNFSGQLMVAINGGRLSSIDLTDPFDPVIRQTLVTAANELVLDNRVVYLAINTDDDPAVAPYAVVDIGINFSISVLSTSGVGFSANDVQLANGVAFFADQLFFNGVPYVNAQDLNNIFFQGVVNMDEWLVCCDTVDNVGLAVDSRYVYSVGTLISQGYLSIGQYIDIDDAAGVAPEVSIVGLPQNTVFPEESSFVVNITADDDIAVRSVDLVLDGIVVASDSTYPYNIPVTLPPGVGIFELEAVAIDFGLNTGVSSSVSIDVRSDIDLDGLLDELEPDYGTDINDPDTDGDGLNDGQEIVVGTDPLDADTDGDGDPDGVEVRRGTNPRSADLEWIGQTLFLSDHTSIGVSRIQDSEIDSDWDLTFTGDLRIEGGLSTIRADQISVLGSLVIDGSEVIVNTDRLLVSDVQLINGARLTIPDGGEVIDINSSGDVYIDSTSAIDLSGKGPSRLISGDEQYSQTGCHAGSAYQDSADENYPSEFWVNLDCSYGRYSQAAHSGTASSSTSSAVTGGGLIKIVASTLINDGSILANGSPTTVNSRGSAGGGIDIDVGELSGIGSFSASAGVSSTRSNGSGGRISVRFDDMSLWVGTFSARGGNGDAIGYRLGAAGTVFVKENSSEFGELTIDNGIADPVSIASLSSTTIESVGRHFITSVINLGNDSWALFVENNVWESDELVGLIVDLDADNELSSLYEIASNGSNYLVVSSSASLQFSAPGKDLIGVHRFERLNITGAAAVDFGGDRVEVNDLPNSDLAEAKLYDLEMPNSDVLYLMQLQENADITFSFAAFDNLTIDTALNVKFDQLWVQNDLIINNAELVANSVAATSLDMNSAVITGTKEVLEINVSGEISIDSTSVIDVTGLGPYAPSVDPAIETHYAWVNCHAGQGNERALLGEWIEEDCLTYGRYSRAEFAGTANISSSSVSLTSLSGGGLLKIEAASLLLDGEIAANAAMNNETGTGVVNSAAGGGVDIDVGMFFGSGLVSAGADAVSTDRNGSGGRISVRADDLSSWSGTLAARGGGLADSDVRFGGAGTVYVKENNEAFGSLTVDNGIAPGSDYDYFAETPVESVGRHLITDAVDIGNGFWSIYVGEDVWHPSTSTFLNAKLDLSGLLVDLSADDDSTPLYEIIDSDANFLTVYSEESLLSIVGQELIGVHQFERLVIRDGVDVNFGGDRIEVADLGGSEISNAILRNFEMPSLQAAYFMENIGDANLSFQFESFDSLTIDTAGSAGKVEFESLIVSGDAILNGIDISAQTMVADNLELSGGARLEVSTSITLAADAQVTVSNSELVVPSLDIGSLVSDEGRLTISEVQLSSELRLENASELTTYEPTEDGYSPLRIIALGDVFVGALSKIDLTGKGFFEGQWGPSNRRNDSIYSPGPLGGCHGGNAADDIDDVVGLDCSYGRYSRAEFAGSAGSFSNGGGYIQIEADSLTLNGEIIANGEPSSRGGAGGGVDIEVDTLAGFGSVFADGGEDGSTGGFTSNGSGGRISVRTENSTLWSGTLSAKGSPFVDEDATADGAGTVYMQTASNELGSLTVDNEILDLPEIENMGATVVEHVGRHEITNVTNIGGDIWQIDTVSGSADFQETGNISSSSASDEYHYFSIGSDHSVKVTLIKEDSGFRSRFELFLDDGVLDESDSTGVSSSSGFSSSNDHTVTTELSAGNYVLAVTSNLGGGDYEIRVESLRTGEEQWKWYEPGVNQQGIQGLTLDLDASDINSPLYTVHSNTSSRVFVSTTDDLSDYVGSELIGVHQFERLNIRDGALVDFGGDRIEIVDIFGSDISNSVLRNFEMPEDALLYLTENNVNARLLFGSTHNVNELTISAPNVEFENLSIQGGLTLDGVSARISNLSAGSLDLLNGARLELDNLILTDSELLVVGQGSELVVPSLLVNSVRVDSGGYLESQNIQLTGDLELLNGSVLTVPDSTEDSYTPLVINVADEVNIDVLSSIDVSGKGLYSGKYGPNSITDTFARGCHGGDGGALATATVRDCAFGRYRQAQFAGSGGSISGSDTGEGGGFVSLTADTLVVDGSIMADGLLGGYSGSGGGIDIAVNTFEGAGLLSAVGVDDIAAQHSSGGRISIRVQDNLLWLGETAVHGGAALSSSYRYAGAGTYYVHDVNQNFGSLLIDNSVSSLEVPDFGVTNIESLGRHTVEAVTDLGGGLWEIETIDGGIDSSELDSFLGGTVGYSSFSIGSDHAVEITIVQGDFIDISTTADLDFVLLRDDGSLDEADYVGEASSPNETIQDTFDLPAGDYLVAVGFETLTVQEAVSGLNNSSAGSEYVISFRSQGEFSDSSFTYEYGLQNLFVDLDASELLSPIYEIESNTPSGLIISTTDDLSGYVGGELIGVHQFERLQILNGASVDFGGDRIEVNDLGNSEVIDAVIQNQDALSNFP